MAVRDGKTGNYQEKLLSKEISSVPNFDLEQVFRSLDAKKSVRKYFVAKEANWGPKQRAKPSSK